MKGRPPPRAAPPSLFSLPSLPFHPPVSRWVRPACGRSLPASLHSHAEPSPRASGRDWRTDLRPAARPRGDSGMVCSRGSGWVFSFCREPDGLQGRRSRSQGPTACVGGLVPTSARSGSVLPAGRQTGSKRVGSSARLLRSARVADSDLAGAAPQLLLFHFSIHVFYSFKAACLWVCMGGSDTAPGPGSGPGTRPPPLSRALMLLGSICLLSLSVFVRQRPRERALEIKVG